MAYGVASGCRLALSEEEKIMFIERSSAAGKDIMGVPSDQNLYIIA